MLNGCRGGGWPPIGGREGGSSRLMTRAPEQVRSTGVVGVGRSERRRELSGVHTLLKPFLTHFRHIENSAGVTTPGRFQHRTHVAVRRRCGMLAFLCEEQAMRTGPKRWCWVLVFVASSLPVLAMAEEGRDGISTLLEAHHSQVVAECRRRGNLFAYYRPLNRCMPLLDDTSPCPDPKHVLVLNATSLEAMCTRLPCDPAHVLLADGRCHTKEEFCAHAEDKELVLMETGYGACDCPDLHVYWQPDDTCYPVYTRGPCAAGEYIVYRESGGRVLCERNPCDEGEVPWEGGCVLRAGHGCLDSVHGHLVLNPASLEYQCKLRCPDGMVEVGLDCHPLYSRGPCPAGQYVVHVQNTWLGRCEENPCKEDGFMPWGGSCWQRGQYCSAPGHLNTATVDQQLFLTSEERTPHRRQPDILPHQSQFIVLSRDQLKTDSQETDTSPSSTAAPVTASANTGHREPSQGPTGDPSQTPSSQNGPGPVADDKPISVPSLGYLPPPPRIFPPPQPGEKRQPVQKPPPPPDAGGVLGLLDILGYHSYHGQASEPTLTRLPAPMLQPMQYTYDGKRIPNPLYNPVGKRRRRRRTPRLAGAASATSNTAERAVQTLTLPQQQERTPSEDQWHPFSGRYDSVTEAHGLHITVNPITHQVECTAGIDYYRTVSFAHYKCRPGSRRDLLGECHHERPTWTDSHPDRCPFGTRHNLLTGKCKPTRA